MFKTICAASALSLIAATASAQEVTLTFSMPSASKSPLCARIAMPWAEKVAADSQGRLKIDVVCDSVLSKDGDTFTRVESGVADIGYDQPPRYGSRFASLLAVTVPGVFDTPDEGAVALNKAVLDGKLGTPEELGDLHPLFFIGFENSTYFLKDKPASATSLDGAKVVSSSKARATLTSEMGGVPVSMNISEFYQAISKGAADGTLTTFGAVMAFNLQEVTNYFITGPFGGSANMVAINREVYEGLPEDLRAILDAASGPEASREYSLVPYNYGVGRFQKEVLTQPGKELVALEGEALAAWQPAIDKSRAEWLADNPNGQAYLDILQEYVAAERAAH